MKKILMIGLLFLGLNGCTDNVRARLYGGTKNIDVPCNQKVVNVTWKEADLWYLTHPMTENDSAEILTFQEKSSFGALEGTIILKECKK